MAAVGKSRWRLVEDMLHVERLGNVRRQVQSGAELLREFHDPDGAVGPHNGEGAARELDVGDRGLQHDRSDLLALLDHLLAGLDDRGAARHQRLGAARAPARDQLVAVALQEPDTLEGNAELGCQHLCEGRGVALAVIERPRDDRDRAVALEADAAHLLLRRRRHLEVVPDTAATQLAARAALRLALLEALPVRSGQRLLEERGEITAVIGGLRRRFEGDLAGLDVVALAELDAVDAELGGGSLHQPLHEIIALGPAGAAIGRDRSGVGEDALGRDLDERSAIDAHHVLGDIHRGHQRRHGGEMRAHVAVIGDADREEMAPGVERQFRRDLMVAAVRVGEEALGALVGPFDGPSQQARRVEEAGIFGIGHRFHAEGATDVAGEHAHFVGRHLQDVVRDLVAQPEHALAAHMERPFPARGVEAADRRARLHRADHEPIVDEIDARHMRRACEGFLHLSGVAVVEIEADIVRDVVVEQGRTGLGGVLRARHRRQRVDIDQHRLRSVLGLRGRLRHHAGDGIAKAAHLVGSERGPHGQLHRRAVAVRKRHHASEGAVLPEVGRGIDAEHARHSLRLGGVDLAEDAVRDAAPHDHRIGLAR